MQVIGLTGGVGSGKSTITHILQEQYGAHVIECDALGHQVADGGGMVTDHPVVHGFHQHQHHILARQETGH